jgi:hypothetical protein
MGIDGIAIDEHEMLEPRARRADDGTAAQSAPGKQDARIADLVLGRGLDISTVSLGELIIVKNSHCFCIQWSGEKEYLYRSAVF